MAKQFSVKVKVESTGKNFKKENKGFSKSPMSSPEELGEVFSGEDFKL